MLGQELKIQQDLQIVFILKTIKFRIYRALIKWGSLQESATRTLRTSTYRNTLDSCQPSGGGVESYYGCQGYQNGSPEFKPTSGVLNM